MMEFDKAAFFKAIGYKPHDGQLKLHTCDKRVRLLACGSRYGKSSAAMAEAMFAMLQPDSMGWVVAPNYELSNKIFRALAYGLVDPKGKVYGGWLNCRPDFVEKFSESTHELRLINGAVARGKTADNPTSLLAEGLDWLVNDECAEQTPRIYEEYLRSRLVDRNGWSLLTSTPKGKNWFYHLFRKGLSPEPGEIYSQVGAMWDNPFIDREKLLTTKNEWTPRAWEQEVLGHFIDEQGAVFTNPRALVRGQPTPDSNWPVYVTHYERPLPNQAYVIGVDLAKHQDWTVLTVLDMGGHIVFWARLPQETNWPYQVAFVKRVSQHYNSATVFADCSGPGDPILDDMHQAEIPAVGVPTAQQKVPLIDALVVATENSRVNYPELPILLNEMEIFEHTKTGTGRDQYHAPEGDGFHDDAVISLSLAWRGIGTGVWGVASKGL